jgi:hypothetical protein
MCGHPGPVGFDASPVCLAVGAAMLGPLAQAPAVGERRSVVRTHGGLPLGSFDGRHVVRDGRRTGWHHSLLPEK